jgi:uncharacterized protein (DUF2344 family)
MALVRSGLAVLYTRGFNPLISMEFASPVSLGINCTGEIACVDLQEPLEPALFTNALNDQLPRGFYVHEAELFIINTGIKKHSLPSLLWGFDYSDDRIPAKEEKSYRLGKEDPKRTRVLAKSDDGPGDYFSVYRSLYKSS